VRELGNLLTQRGTAARGMRSLRDLLTQRGTAARGVRELLVLAALYVAYSGTRLFADDALAPAEERARALVDAERLLGLQWERPVNRLFADVDLLGLFGSYWYATAHYVVTAVVLVWLYRRGPAAYLPARRALLLATVLGLALYLLLPMAPPRLTPGYVDVLNLHSAVGWWGSEASAPRGLGGFTNQLAAFPSLHAGWALWVALAIRSATTNRALRALGWTHAVVTAVVVVGTGNHWVLDAVVGWLIVMGAWIALDRAKIGEESSPGPWRRGARRRLIGPVTTTEESPTCASGPSSQQSPPSRSPWA
jgi:hypothetical protein